MHSSPKEPRQDAPEFFMPAMPPLAGIAKLEDFCANLLMVTRRWAQGFWREYHRGWLLTRLTTQSKSCATKEDSL
jgi:hypothetical protein